MLYLVYMTTNVVNGRYYIGSHATPDMADGYLGSGSLLRRAINKYGAAAFSREVLFECASEEEMRRRERELVTETVCNDKRSYNLAVGGGGGFGYINRSGLNGWRFKPHDQYVMAGKAAGAVFRRKMAADNALRERMRAVSRANRASTPGLDWSGRKHKPETIALIRSAHVGRQPGAKNGAFGCRWMKRFGVTERVNAREVCDRLAGGWTFGRLLKS